MGAGAGVGGCPALTTMSGRSPRLAKISGRPSQLNGSTLMEMERYREMDNS